MQSPPSPRYAHARQPSSFDLARPLALTVNSVKALKSSFSPSGDFLGASRNPVLGDRGSKADKDGNAGVLSDESDDDRHEQRAQRYVEEFLQGADQMDQTISVESAPADGNERNEIERSIERVPPSELKLMYVDVYVELMDAINSALILECKVSDMDDDLARMENKLDERDETIEVLQLQLNAADEYSEALLQEKKETMNKLTEAKSELAMLSVRYSKLQSATGNSPNRDGSHNTMESTKNSNESTLRGELTEANETVRELQEQLDSLRSEAEQLSKDRKDSDTIIKKLQDELESRKDSQEASMGHGERSSNDEHTSLDYKELYEEQQAYAKCLEEEISKLKGTTDGTGSALDKVLPDHVQMKVATRRLRESKKEVERLASDLKEARAQIERQTEVENKLLADISYMTKQLRNKDTNERENRQLRRSDLVPGGNVSRYLTESKTTSRGSPPPRGTDTKDGAHVDPDEATKRRREIIMRALEQARKKRVAEHTTRPSDTAKGEEEDTSNSHPGRTDSPSPPRHERKVSGILRLSSDSKLSASATPPPMAQPAKVGTSPGRTNLVKSIHLESSMHSQGSAPGTPRRRSVQGPNLRSSKVSDRQPTPVGRRASMNKIPVSPRVGL